MLLSFSLMSVRVSCRTMRPKAFDQQQALQAAMLQFWESGYEGSSMQDLVKRMGISRQSLYDTYGNKRELFIQALRCYRHQVVEPRLRDLADPTRDPIKALREHLQGIINGWNDQIRGCLMVRTTLEMAPDDAAVAKLVAENTRQLRDALRAVVERGQASGVIDPSRSAEELAARLMALSAGLHVCCRLPDPDGASLPSVDSLIAGLRVH
ncbi:MAG: TetR family transcriptional regulator [Gammaproteobacteria bacterium HGW-Gammaproteobacteria-8]|nr:MAG: TetR family transcriptional regulator [Gammaproteobacteria bacterium HGW-Gammaproteobacteria-8]